MKLPLTTIGLVIFTIGLALQVYRLEGRVDRLEHRGAVTTSVPADAWKSCLEHPGCSVATPN